MDARWENQQEQLKANSKVTKTDIELFLNTSARAAQRGKKLSPYTYNKKLAILSGFFRKYLFEEQGILTTCPITRGMRRSEGQPIILFLTRKEQEQVLTQAFRNKESGRRDFVIVYLALNTGLRLSELAALNLNDIDMAGDLIYIRHCKGDKPRQAPP